MDHEGREQASLNGCRGIRFPLFFATLSVALFALLPATWADNIGVDFVGGSIFNGPSMSDSDVAGFVPQRFWNNALGDQGSMNLQGDAGTSMAVYYSGLTVSWVAASGMGETGNTNTDGNSLMMNGYLLGLETDLGSITPAVTVDVTNMPAALAANGYAVVVYFDADNGSADIVNELTLTAPYYGPRHIFGLDKASANFSGTFQQVPSSSTTDLGGSTPAGNFVVFSGLTDDSFELTSTPGSTGGSLTAFINGFQIVPDSALPAPPAPVITSSATATGVVNTFFNYTVTANNAPIGFGASGLPSGLSIQPSNGIISGTPTVPGTYDITLTATNSGGTGSLSLTLTIGDGLAVNPSNTGTTNALTGGSLLDINDGLVAGSNGTLLTTTNGGQSWGMLDVGLTNDLLAVHGIGGYEFVGGTFGLIALSGDGGQNWTSYDLKVTNSIRAFSFLTPLWGDAAGSGGIIYFWDGLQWLPQVTGTTADFYSIDVVDYTTAYAAGGQGTICRADGTNWVAQSTGTTTVTFYGVDFLNEDFGYAVGSGGAIYRTADGGTNWVALDSGTTATLRSVQVINADTAWAVGDNGTFLQTTDGGAHWTAISLGTTATLYSVAFVDGRGLITGVGGVVYFFVQAAYTLNASPVVSLLSPTNNASICVCSETPVTTSAYDPDGSISKLQLYLGPKLLAESASGSLTYVWTNDTALGTFRCVAKATDNLGATAYSAPVTFTVHPPATNQLVVLGWLPTNAFEFCVGGLTNRVYNVQTATNLTGPWSAWREVTNRFGFVQVVDPNVSTNTRKFYRSALTN